MKIELTAKGRKYIRNRHSDKVPLDPDDLLYQRLTWIDSYPPKSREDWIEVMKDAKLVILSELVANDYVSNHEYPWGSSFYSGSLASPFLKMP